MSELEVVAASIAPLTRPSLVAALRDLGVAPGACLLVHSSLRALGWVAGGPVTVIEALLEALGDEGTLLMPTHTSENSDPSNWHAPPVPPSWWPILRAELPAYDPARTPSRGMGRIAETFRSWPGVLRSEHPIGSFAGRGPLAAGLLAGHDSLEEMFGEESPIGRLFQRDGSVLLLGVGHDSNTSLHLAEYRARGPRRRYVREGTAMMFGGRRRWLVFDMQALETDDFPALGAAFEAERGLAPGRVGRAAARLFPVRPLVDFAVGWLDRNRP